MKKSDVFPSRFFKADDVSVPKTLTIVGGEYETLKNHKGKDEQKLVLSFLKTKKLLVVNVTNFDKIVEVTGEPDSDDWGGHAIQLYATETQVGTEMKPCVRVRKAEQPDLALKKKPVSAKASEERRRGRKAPAGRGNGRRHPVRSLRVSAMTDPTISLEIFCHPDRPELVRPFSIDTWTYATNGHVLVRVPGAMMLPKTKRRRMSRACFPTHAPKPRYRPAPKFEIPERFDREEECFGCGGTGKAHHH